MTTSDLLKGIVLVVVLIIGFYMGLRMWGGWYDEWSGYTASQYVSDGICNIAVIPLMGDVYGDGPMYDEYGNLASSADPDTFSAALRKAESDSYILGVMVAINSPGGSPVGGEMIANYLLRSPLPSAAVIRDIGTSAAYLAATGADTIIASELSDVGDIGITMSYLDYSAQNELDGVEFVSLASVPYKDYGNPNRPLTDEERSLFERDLALFHEVFVRQVSVNRGLPQEEVARVADGSSLPASMALEAKLIDSLGDEETARAWFAEQLGLEEREVVLCHPY